MDNKIKYGMVGLVTLLMGMGGTMILSPNELSNVYYCNTLNSVGIFYGGISSTGLTGYPYAENRTNPVKCTGKWVLLKEYAKSIGVDPLLLMQGSYSRLVARQYLCDQVKCTETNGA